MNARSVWQYTLLTLQIARKQNMYKYEFCLSHVPASFHQHNSVIETLKCIYGMCRKAFLIFFYFIVKYIFHSQLLYSASSIQNAITVAESGQILQ